MASRRCMSMRQKPTMILERGHGLARHFALSEKKRIPYLCRCKGSLPRPVEGSTRDEQPDTVKDQQTGSLGISDHCRLV